MRKYCTSISDFQGKSRTMLVSKKSLLLVVVALHSVSCFVQPLSITRRRTTTTDVTSPQISTPLTRSCSLQMGLLDQISKAFLQEREGDFIKLEDSDDSSSGLGPAILLYNVPPGILDEELVDMLQDGAPNASKKGVTLQRMPDMKHPLLELTLEEALVKALDDQASSEAPSSTNSPIATPIIAPVNRGNPVLIFSGFANPEMMASYNIIAEEIFRENGGRAACAKAVPNALPKPLRQVVEEISGDHENALEMQGEPAE
mmetsp:Transcript_27681/g.67356  ORF Transcript_27681/g.67356 Transcript_27681/m.67356 type:complete len:259 (+) Transcript_27681:178-954(+)